MPLSILHSLSVRWQQFQPRMRSIARLPLCLVLIAPLYGCDEPAPSMELTEAWRLTGFSQPESAVYDAATDTLYVSNISGPPNEKNGQGFVSRLSPQGTLVELKWLEGLNAPKGMAIMGNTLYIADVDRLAQADMTTKDIQFYEAPGAKFLNDVAVAEDGSVYVSDMLDDAIYRLQNGVFSLWLQDPALEFPNGLLVEGDTLVVGSWGVIDDPAASFSTSVPGSMKRIGLSERTIAPFSAPLGNLDGVEASPNGGYTVTDWLSGGLWSVSQDGKASLILDLNQGSADHDYMAEAGLIIIPMMLDNEVVAYRVANQQSPASG